MHGVYVKWEGIGGGRVKGVSDFGLAGRWGFEASAVMVKWLQVGEGS